MSRLFKKDFDLLMDTVRIEDAYANALISESVSNLEIGITLEFCAEDSFPCQCLSVCGLCDSDLLQ